MSAHDPRATLRQMQDAARNAEGLSRRIDASVNDPQKNAQRKLWTLDLSSPPFVPWSRCPAFWL